MSEIQPVVLACSNFEKRVRQRVASSTGWRVALPSRVSIAPTFRCMMRCQQCDIWKLNPIGYELTAQQWKDTLLRLRKWLGCFHLNITGGEPFLRPDIIELLRYSSDIGIAVGVVTNGYMLTEKMAGKVLASNPFNINVSLDGAVAEIHDRIRGKSGAYQRALDAIDNLTQASDALGSTTRLIIKVTVMEQNLGEIPGLINLVQVKRLTGVLFQPLDDTLWSGSADPRWYEKSSLWVRDYESADRAIEGIIEAKRGGSPILNSYNHLLAMKAYFKCPAEVAPSPSKPCVVGWQNLDIGYDGHVRFCDYLPPFGNITQSHPADLWHSPEASRVRQMISKCTRPCLATCHLERTLSEQASMAFGLFFPKAHKQL